MGVGIPKCDYVGAFLWGTITRSLKPWFGLDMGHACLTHNEHMCTETLYMRLCLPTAINFNRTLTKMAAHHRSEALFQPAASMRGAVYYVAALRSCDAAIIKMRFTLLKSTRALISFGASGNNCVYGMPLRDCVRMARLFRHQCSVWDGRTDRFLVGCWRDLRYSLVGAQWTREGEDEWIFQINKFSKT